MRVARPVLLFGLHAKALNLASITHNPKLIQRPIASAG